MHNFRVAVLVMALAAGIRPLAAQNGTAASIKGVVRDLGGAPIADARLFVADGKRKAQGGEDGVVRLLGLPPGDTVQVIVARLGYRPLHVAIVLTAGENELTFILEPIAHQLDVIRTEASSAGVFGVVGDTSYTMLQDARAVVSDAVASERATNEMGQFAVDPLRPGAYFLTVTKAGYRPRLVSFVQPPRGGTRLVIWMTPLPADASAGQSQFENRTVQELYDFKKRTSYQGMGGTIVARDVLATYGHGMTLAEALDQIPGRVIRGLRARDFTQAKFWVDGTVASGMTLADFNADDVELVELYSVGGDIATWVTKRWELECPMDATAISRSTLPTGEPDRTVVEPGNVKVRTPSNSASAPPTSLGVGSTSGHAPGFGPRSSYCATVRIWLKR